MLICCWEPPGHRQPGQMSPEHPPFTAAADSPLNVLSRTWTVNAPRRGSYGDGAGRVGVISPSGWQLWPAHRCSELRWLRFFFSPSGGAEAIIPERSSNLVMSSGDKRRISHLNHNLDCKPSSRRQFPAGFTVSAVYPVYPAVYIGWHPRSSGASYRFDNLFIQTLPQLDSVNTISSHLSASVLLIALLA